MKEVQRLVIIGVGLVFLTIAGALAGCGGSSSSASSTATSTNIPVSTQAWPTLATSAQLPDLQQVLGEPVPGLPGCAFAVSEGNGGPEGKCKDGSTFSLSTAISSEKPVSLCTKLPGQEVSCEVNTVGAFLYASTSNVARGKQILRALLEELSSIQEANGGQATQESMVSGVATDQEGDKVRLTIAAGAPSSVHSLSDPTLNSCDEDIGVYGSSPERSLAIPINVDVQVLSSPGPDLVVDLGEFGALEGNGYAEPNALNALWAENFSSEMTCEIAAEGGSVHWYAEGSSGTNQSWEAWLILLNAITPNSSGVETADRIVISPLIRLSDSTAEIEYDKGVSPNLVSCTFGSGGIEPQPVFALDKQTALSEGCTS